MSASLNGATRDVMSDSEDEMVNGVGVGVGGENGVAAAINGSSVTNGVVDSHYVPQADRIKKKARRLLSRQLSRSSKDGKEVVVKGTNVVQPPRFLKNSRRSRSRYGRGLPKKGGAGGKGVWGKLGSELDGVPLEDPDDPNYDSETLDEVQLKAVVPELSEEEVHNCVEPLILEYFENGDSDEVAASLEDVNFGCKRYLITVVVVEISMDHKPSHREMASVLISDLYYRAISPKDIAKGFDTLLKNLPDLILDTPEAPVVLGNFVARAVADDCIPPKFVENYKGRVECQLARQALSRAETLITMKHGLVRLDNVWGVGGGTRPVKYLITKMVLLLEEYLSSGDLQEAGRCLSELEVPHFHHEMVYEAVVHALEAACDKTDESVVRLLKYLYASAIVTADQFSRGFLRVHEDMPDISLDVPTAYGSLERFVIKARGAGVVSDEVVLKITSKGRKRFVSEGDGGRLKESS